jgi:hypothetical protein
MHPMLILVRSGGFFFSLDDNFASDGVYLILSFSRNME